MATRLNLSNRCLSVACTFCILSPNELSIPSFLPVCLQEYSDTRLPALAKLS